MKQLKVGILGGLGPAATILYYRRLNEGLNKLDNQENRTDFLIYSLESSRIKKLYNQGATNQIVDNLVESIICLEAGGCDFGNNACNTAHLFIDAVQNHIKLPLINLIDIVVDKICSSNLDSVGLLGTTMTMETSLYRPPLEEKGFMVLTPSKLERLDYENNLH